MQKTLFNQMPLSKEILRAVEDMGFEEATTIQSSSIPLLLEGKDVIGHSQTGTGKTAAFSIPIIEKISTSNSKAVQALVLCPTRELALQACEEIKKFAKYKPDIKAVAIYGGQQIDRQFIALRKKPQIVVGTPGRIMDHIKRKTLKLNELSTVVLDEADEMLSMGFREDIETILKGTPQERQTVLFSATLSREILQITKQYQTEPEMVKVTQEQVTVPNIEQLYYEVPQGQKIDVLCRIIDIQNPTRSIVFCNTKRMVDELTSALQFRGYSAKGLHGDIKQSTRTQIMNEFKAGTIDLLVATDVAARGIDVDNVEIVFNFDIPQDVEYYVHRIGRTGRAGKPGSSITFARGRRQMQELKDIERSTKSKIHFRKIPTYDETMEVRSAQFVARVKTAIEEGKLEQYNSIVDALLEEFSSPDVTAGLIKMIMEKDGKTGQENTQLEREIENRREGRENRSRQDKKGRRSTRVKPKRKEESNSDKTNLSINIGSKHNVSASHILGAIAGETGLPGTSFGRIEIFDSFSLVAVPSQSVDSVIEAMRGCKIKGRKTSTKKA